MRIGFAGYSEITRIVEPSPKPGAASATIQRPYASPPSRCNASGTRTMIERTAAICARTRFDLENETVKPRRTGMVKWGNDRQ